MNRIKDAGEFRAVFWMALKGKARLDHSMGVCQGKFADSDWSRQEERHREMFTWVCETSSVN